MGKIKMNILIISAPDPYKVAGTVAYNLYKGLNDRGNTVKLVVNAYGKYPDPGITCMQTYGDVLFKKVKNRYLKFLNKFIKVLKKKDSDYSIQDLDETIEHYRAKDILKKAGFKPDVILYLFPQNFLNAKNLYELNKLTGAPVYWYLMDSAALTGGCHYSWDCKRFTTGCGKCPGLFSEDENDQTAINFRFKNHYLSLTDISIVSATEWQYRLALESLLFKEKAMEKILLSVDPEVFNCIPKKEAKKKYGIPDDKKVIFFGSAFLNERRKGMKYLMDALKILKQTGNAAYNNILLLIAGNDFDLIKNELPFDYRYMGLLANNEQLAEAFQASDIYVCPSIEDSGPMMINQAVMCGIPTVAFDMGVAKDLVITGVTGHRAKLMDTNDLARGISTVLLLDEISYNQYAENCRKLALELFTPQVQIEKFEKLFMK
jgi:glycosyltransferase involved in cell wall biosynthesis